MALVLNLLLLWKRYPAGRLRPRLPQLSEVRSGQGSLLRGASVQSTRRWRAFAPREQVRRLDAERDGDLTIVSSVELIACRSSWLTYARLQSARALSASCEKVVLDPEPLRFSDRWFREALCAFLSSSMSDEASLVTGYSTWCSRYRLLPFSRVSVSVLGLLPPNASLFGAKMLRWRRDVV